MLLGQRVWDQATIDWETFQSIAWRSTGQGLMAGAKLIMGDSSVYNKIIPVAVYIPTHEYRPFTLTWHAI